METFTGIVYNNEDLPEDFVNNVVEVWNRFDYDDGNSAYVLVKDVITKQKHFDELNEFYVVVLRGKDVTDFVLSE